MKSSPSRTIININQVENLQKKKVQRYDNMLERQIFCIKESSSDDTLKHSTSSLLQSSCNSMYRQNISKISLLSQHVEDHQEKSSVSLKPSLDVDGKNSTSSRHILKIEISPKKVLKSREEEINCGDLKEVSGDDDNRKMSIVSRVNKNKNKSVTIIRHDEEESSNDYENLSDDQKLLNGVVQKVTCNGGGGSHVISRKSELIDLRSACNNAGNVGRVMLSGHCSPCGGSGDSGTCSDVEANALGSMSESPPPLPPKTYKLKMEQLKLSESTCSDASSTDSMQYHQLISPELIRTVISNNKDTREDLSSSFVLPTSLLRDIRNHSLKFDDNDSEEEEEEDEEEELNYSDIVICNNSSSNSKNNRSDNENEFYDDDKFYKFHMNENFSSLVSINDVQGGGVGGENDEGDESFAGFKDLRSGSSTIRSAKGTIRGVKNRVRNGIVTFLQMQQTTVKNFKEKDGGKIVLYTTSMGVVRSTHAKCQAVKQILRTLMVKFEERDVFMSYSYQQDIRDRMQKDFIDVPQLFVDGQYVGNVDQVERLNETGELRAMLKPYRSRDCLKTCKMCGGYKMLPCPSCGGSKKSVHRNHFTAEFVALKCMNCDEVGLVKCYNC